MYPCLQPGDVLHVEARTVCQVAVGDIAVCRRTDSLFSHRTIRKGVHDGRLYIITRPDRSSDGDDGPTYDEDLLGIVTGIDRKDKRVDPRPRRYHRLERFYLASRFESAQLSHAVQSRLTDLLARIQRRSGYRRAARLWLAAGHTKASYVVRLPLQAETAHDVYRCLPPDGLDLTGAAWQGGTVDRWMLALHLDGNRRPAAWATFLRRPSQCPLAGWWVDDLQVRVRYRGAGFEEGLLAKAEEILARSGVTELRASVHGQLAVAADIYRGLGFREAGARGAHDDSTANAGQSARMFLHKSIPTRART